MKKRTEEERRKSFSEMKIYLDMGLIIELLCEINENLKEVNKRLSKK